MIKRDLNKRVLIVFSFILLIVTLNSCAVYHEYEGVFPPSSPALSKYQKIVVVNEHRDQLVSNLLENAIKTKLTSIEPGNITPTKSLESLGKELTLFKFNPRIDQIADHKIAYLSFEIEDNTSITRERDQKTVSLRSCNYLRKKNQCQYTGRTTLSSGKQTINVNLTGKIYLKNKSGAFIVPPFNINERVIDRGATVSSALDIISKRVNDIAYQFTKQVIPHKEKIKSEILKDGDSVSVSLIENKAYNTAANRLSQIISKEEEPEPADIYNLGVTYEALTEVISAAKYYQKAHDIEPDNDVINIALRRIRRVVPE